MDNKIRKAKSIIVLCRVFSYLAYAVPIACLFAVIYFYLTDEIKTEFINAVQNVIPGTAGMAIVIILMMVVVPILTILICIAIHKIIEKIAAPWYKVLTDNLLIPELRKRITISVYDHDKYITENRIQCQDPSGSDYIKGFYRDASIEFSNLRLVNGKGRGSVTIFRGICIIYYPNKEVNGSSMIELEYKLERIAYKSEVNIYNKSGFILYLPGRTLFDTLYSESVIKNDTRYLFDILELTYNCMNNDLHE